MQHTKEPWPEVDCDSDDETGITCYTIPGVAKFKRDADAERARACVNAIAVIERQGWGVMKGKSGWYAVDSDGNGIEHYTTPDWPDPATALIEAEKVLAKSEKGTK